MFRKLLISTGLLALTAFAGAAQAAPTAITACTNITSLGAHVLTQNINATAVVGDCIRILAPHVTLDLNGFVIAGPQAIGGAVSGDGIVVLPASDNVTVRDGTVTGFRTGVVFLAGQTGAVVENVRALSNEFHGIFATGDAILTRNFASGNDLDGIKFGFGSTVLSNTSINNGEDGFDGACDSSVLFNTAIDNAGANFNIFDAGSLTCVFEQNAGQ